MIPFRTELLPNGLRLEFLDHSNRYFGDYWRVHVEARCTVPLDHAFPEEGTEKTSAHGVLGGEAIFSRPLEKMGVAGNDVAAVRDTMVQSFLRTTAPYLGTPGFPLRFVRQQVAERRRGHRPFLVRP